MTKFLTLCSPLLVLALIGSNAASTQAPESTLTYAKNSCGTTFNETSGSIQYKVFETIQVNERCVWTISVPGAVGYTFNLYNAYFGDRRNGLNIAGLSLGSHTLHQFDPREVDIDYYVEGNVAILTFYSSTAYLERGFSLLFTANITDNSEVSSQSVSKIVSELEASISHPLDTTGALNYTNNELSTFVFTPEFAKNSTNQIGFTNLGLDGITCKDFLDVFKFNYENRRWTDYGRLCGADTDATFSDSDIIFVAFHSDSDVVGRGFVLNYQKIE